MKRYQLTVSHAEKVADHLLQKGEGQIWSHEVLEELVERLESSGDKDAQFYRVENGCEIIYSLEDMRICLDHLVDARPRK